MADSRNRPSTEPVLEALATRLRSCTDPGQSAVIGFSGGLDSTVLLHATSRVAHDAGLNLSALHVHHGLSTHADEWARHCERVCSALAVPLIVRRVIVPSRTGEGAEAAARRVRHEAFSAHPADWILLAHHANDQAETVLHNLLRGTGVRGAAGIPEMRGRILRPLLGLAREELASYATSFSLEWIEDESNADGRHTRNYLRHEILPLLARRFPRAGDQLAGAAGRFAEAELLLNELAAVDLGGRSREFPLPLTLFRGLSDARARNLLRAMLGWYRMPPPNQDRLNEFVRQIKHAAHDKRPRLELKPYALWCEAGELRFRRTA